MRRALMCLTAALFLLAPSSRWLAAQEPTLIDSADYDFPDDPSVSPWLPDPAVWAGTGQLYADNGYNGLNPIPTPADGLGINDSSNVTSRMYTHASPALATPGATGSIRVLGGHMDLWVGAAHWNNSNRTGWRLILDDGVRRLELATGRTAPVEGSPRVLEVVGAPGVPLIPFTWDNGFNAWYELSRAANGDFTVSITDTAPVPQAPIEITIPAATLPASSGTPQFAWGSALTGGTFSFWQEAHAEVFGRPTSTLRLDTRRLTLNRGWSRYDSEIGFAGSAIIGAGEKIDPATQAVTLKFENTDGTVFDAVIPAGSFVKTFAGYRLYGVDVGDAEVSGRLVRRSKVRWDFEFEFENVEFKLEPRTLIKTTLGVGNKVGTDTIRVTKIGGLRYYRKTDRRTTLSWWLLNRR